VALVAWAGEDGGSRTPIATHNIVARKITAALLTCIVLRNSRTIVG